MTATISHEVKNVLAIINENAGLLEDLSLMEQKGIKIDPDRLISVTGKIKQQVKRADVIIKNLNRFGHSTDEAVQEIDLEDTVTFMIALCERNASNRDVTLGLNAPDSVIKATTNLFLLQNLIWLCLDFALDAVGDEKNVMIDILREDTGKVIILFTIKGFINIPGKTFPTDEEHAILDALHGSILTNTTTEEISVTLPENINQLSG